MSTLYTDFNPGIGLPGSPNSLTFSVVSYCGHLEVDLFFWLYDLNWCQLPIKNKTVNIFNPLVTTDFVKRWFLFYYCSWLHLVSMLRFAFIFSCFVHQNSLGLIHVIILNLYCLTKVKLVTGLFTIWSERV